MSVQSIFKSAFNEVKKIFGGVKHEYEVVQVAINARPGLKKDLTELAGPFLAAAKDAFAAEKAKIEGQVAGGASPADVAAGLKTAAPALLETVKGLFADKVSHSANLFTLADLAYQTIAAAAGI